MIKTLAPYFPYGMQQYAIGGLLVGAGIALLFIATGRQGGASTFFSAAWSYVIKTPFFQQPLLRDTRQWRTIHRAGRHFRRGVAAWGVGESAVEWYWQH